MSNWRKINKAKQPDISFTTLNLAASNSLDLKYENMTSRILLNIDRSKRSRHAYCRPPWTLINYYSFPSFLWEELSCGIYFVIDEATSWGDRDTGLLSWFESGLCIWLIMFTYQLFGSGEHTLCEDGLSWHSCMHSTETTLVLPLVLNAYLLHKKRNERQVKGTAPCL